MEKETIFAKKMALSDRLKNNNKVIVFEDGLQTRDFVSVHDVVRALILSLEKNAADNQLFNIGSGEGTRILKVAQTLSKLLKKPGLIQVNYQFRKNDIRHCFADISKAKRILGWQSKISLGQGLKEWIEWSQNQNAEDRFSQALQELKSYGL